MSDLNFPRGVTDPFCSQDHTLDDISTDRRLLWHLELVLSSGPEYQRDTARAVARYLHDTCEHHWHESLTCCDPPNDGCIPPHRQCLWCNTVEWADDAPDEQPGGAA